MTYEQVMADLRRTYDRAAERRDTMDDPPWKQAERVRFLRLLHESGATRLLEVGAGHGVSGRFFADQGLDVVCTDLSAELVDRCRAKGLTAYRMDFCRLDFAEASFDAAFGMNCLLRGPVRRSSRSSTSAPSRPRATKRSFCDAAPMA